jgi:hypothetical protein
MVLRRNTEFHSEATESSHRKLKTQNLKLKTLSTFAPDELPANPRLFVSAIADV